MPRTRIRCAWARPSNPRYLAYHDEEWGVPVHADRRLFEMLILEGAQAGLAWETILDKRAAYRAAFDRFDPRRVARYGAARRRALLANPGIVRNRAKIEAAIANARAFLAVQAEFGSFDAWLWRFVDGRPLQGRPVPGGPAPAFTPVSEALARELRRRGFRFVGPTICHAFMQAVGMVNDHAPGCFRRREVAALARAGGPAPAPRAGAAKSGVARGRAAR